MFTSETETFLRFTALCKDKVDWTYEIEYYDDNETSNVSIANKRFKRRTYCMEIEDTPLKHEPEIITINPYCEIEKEKCDGKPHIACTGHGPDVPEPKVTLNFHQ